MIVFGLMIMLFLFPLPETDANPRIFSQKCDLKGGDFGGIEFHWSMFHLCRFFLENSLKS